MLLQYEDYAILAITALFAGRFIWMKTCDKGAACQCARKQQFLTYAYLFLFLTPFVIAKVFKTPYYVTLLTTWVAYFSKL